jgi:hypothetical protein
MRSALSLLLLMVFLVNGVSAKADSIPAPSNPAPGHAETGRVGILPQSWVETLERNEISEQTALIAAGTSAVAIGVGVFAGAGAGAGATGATLAAVWLAHLPFHFALWGGAGYVGWNYLWPVPQPVPADTVAVSLRTVAIRN